MHSFLNFYSANRVFSVAILVLSLLFQTPQSQLIIISSALGHNILSLHFAQPVIKRASTYKTQVFLFLLLTAALSYISIIFVRYGLFIIVFHHVFTELYQGEFSTQLTSKVQQKFFFLRYIFYSIVYVGFVRNLPPLTFFSEIFFLKLFLVFFALITLISFIFIPKALSYRWLFLDFCTLSAGLFSLWLGPLSIFEISAYHNAAWLLGPVWFGIKNKRLSQVRSYICKSVLVYISIYMILVLSIHFGLVTLEKIAFATFLTGLVHCVITLFLSDTNPLFLRKVVPWLRPLHN